MKATRLRRCETAASAASTLQPPIPATRSRIRPPPKAKFCSASTASRDQELADVAGKAAGFAARNPGLTLGILVPSEPPRVRGWRKPEPLRRRIRRTPADEQTVPLGRGRPWMGAVVHRFAPPPRPSAARLRRGGPVSAGPRGPPDSWSGRRERVTPAAKLLPAGNPCVSPAGGEVHRFPSPGRSRSGCGFGGDRGVRPVFWDTPSGPPPCRWSSSCSPSHRVSSAGTIWPGPSSLPPTCAGPPATSTRKWRLPELAADLLSSGRGVPCGSRGGLRAGSRAGEPDDEMHRAKGLEWDLVVYLVGADGDFFHGRLEERFRGDYDFPGRRPGRDGFCGSETGALRPR